MDDQALISNDYLTHNLKFLPKAFERTMFGTGIFYRPLSKIFLMAEYFFFKLNTFGYHFVNILLHFINCLLFFRIINFLFDNYNLSLLSTALFAVHPVHNTVINQGVGSEVLLVSIFMLLSLLSFIEFSLRNKFKFYYLSIIFFIIALFFRENAMLFPFYLLCFTFFYLKEGKFSRYVSLILPFFICSFGYFLFRLFFFSLKGAIFNEFTKTFSFFGYISGFLRLIFLYLYSIIIPNGIVWIWGIPPQEKVFGIEIIIFLLISLVVIYSAIRYWKKSVEYFGLAWFLIGAIPAILMISSRYSLGLSMEPQWFYSSSIGIFLLISIFLLKLKKYINYKLWFCLILSLLLFYFSETRRYNYLWKDPETYYKYWLKKYPNNIARLNLANIYASKGKCAAAEFLYKEAISHSFLKKGNKLLFSSRQVSRIYNDLSSLCYYKLGKLDDALIIFNKAIEIDPSNSLAYFNRANIFLKHNKLNEAISDYEKSIAINPYNLDSHYNLAILYARLNKEDKAIEEYFKVVALDKNCFKNNKGK